MTAAERLAEIEARVNAASAGPWVYDALDGRIRSADVPPTSTTRRVFSETVFEVYGSCDDADFAAAARTDIPALVAALRAVLELADKWGAEFDAADLERTPSTSAGRIDAMDDAGIEIRDAITAALDGA